MPFHGPLDRAIDASRNDLWRSDGTGRGISTCVADKHGYEGFRVADLMSQRIRRDRLVYLLERGNARLRGLDAEEVDIAAATAEVESWVELLKPYVCNTMDLLIDAARAGKEILLEGAQAALLDVDFGTYPFVSASNTGANGIPSGTGLPLGAIDRVIAVAKAYLTRVGNGPFPTEDSGPAGTRMQEIGREFGTVTGRMRRCGWYDALAMRHVCRINGVNSLAITKIDVLSGIDPLRICVAYELDGAPIDTFPADLDVLQRCRPVYREVPGFSEDLTGARSPADLPDDARAYLEVLEEETGVSVEILSVGPDRAETLTMEAR